MNNVENSIGKAFWRNQSLPQSFRKPASVPERRTIVYTQAPQCTNSVRLRECLRFGSAVALRGDCFPKSSWTFRPLKVTSQRCVEISHTNAHTSTCPLATNATTKCDLTLWRVTDEGQSLLGHHNVRLATSYCPEVDSETSAANYKDTRHHILGERTCMLTYKVSSNDIDNIDKPIPNHNNFNVNYKRDRQCTSKRTLEVSVRVTIVAVAKQLVFHILSVCL